MRLPQPLLLGVAVEAGHRAQPAGDRGREALDVGMEHLEQPQAVLLAPGEELAQVQGIGVAGQAAVAVAGQEPGEREPLGIAEGRVNAAVVDVLAPSSSDRILDVGFGGGVALRYVVASPAKSVVGVDLSQDMVARARRVFSKELSSGRLRVEHASAERLPFEDRSFDGVYSVNSIYFWPDPIRGLAELRRVLGDDGRVVLGVDPRSKKQSADPFRGFDNKDAEEALLKAGFAEVTIHESRGPRQVVSARRG